MTLRLADPGSIYATDVTIQAPLPEGGFADVDVVIHYKLIPTSDYRDLAMQGDKELVQAIVAGWEGIEGADGKPLPYTRKNAGMLADLPYVAGPVCDGYRQRFSPEKNSKPPRAI